ncbi:MAG: nuclear transport factor 2 family protein [Chloracidobacterium sp.]|nr:nuclear transport factor 2 family protein [Chloracidobacterium sp.]
MTKILITLLFSLGALMLAGCGGPTGNTPANGTNANSNANANKTTAAAPTADSMLAKEKQAHEAYFKGDSKHFEEILNDKFVEVVGGARMGRADIIKAIGGTKCEVKDGWTLDDPQMAKIDDNTYAISYKGTIDGSCTGPDGKSMKMPSPVRGASIWVRNGEKWQAVYHGETAIMSPDGPPPAPPASHTDAPAPANTNTSANANAAPAPAAPTPSANTDALVKIHTEGWEAWKAKDAARLTAMAMPGLSIVDPAGRWFSGRENVVKAWTDMKCEGVTKVGIKEGFSTAISPTVELLTLHGTADGTCDGQKNGDLHQTAVYVKDGAAWKLAFMFESPA